MDAVVQCEIPYAIHILFWEHFQWFTLFSFTHSSTCNALSLSLPLHAQTLISYSFTCDIMYWRKWEFVVFANSQASYVCRNNE